MSDRRSMNMNKQGNQGKRAGRCESSDQGDMDDGDIVRIGREDTEWADIQITIESGAVGTVGPTVIGTGLPIQLPEA